MMDVHPCFVLSSIDDLMEGMRWHGNFILENLISNQLPSLPENIGQHGHPRISYNEKFDIEPIAESTREYWTAWPSEDFL